MAERGFQTAALFGFRGAVRTPGHHGMLQAQQTQVAQYVLAVFLGRVHLVRIIRIGAPDEFLIIGEKMPPLGLQKVHDIEIFSPRLELRAHAG